MKQEKISSKSMFSADICNELMFLSYKDPVACWCLYFLSRHKSFWI